MPFRRLHSNNEDNKTLYTVPGPVCIMEESPNDSEEVKKNVICLQSSVIHYWYPQRNILNSNWVSEVKSFAHLYLRNILPGRQRDFITKTCLYNFDPLELPFYIVKLGFTGVYIIFLISAQNIDCGYSLKPPRRGGSNEYPQSMFWAEILKKSEFFYLKIFNFFLGEMFYIFE